MKNDCGILNPLQRDGTSQKQRLVRALHPTYVKVDERELPDLLLYAKEYATKIRYYSNQNQLEGDWQAFIESDISTCVSIIKNTSLEERKEYFDRALQEAKRKREKFNIQEEFPPEEVFEILNHLFTPIFSLGSLIDNWYNHSVEGLLLNTDLTKLINSILNNSLRNTFAFALRVNELLDSPINIPYYLAPIWNQDNIQTDTLFLSSFELIRQGIITDDETKEKLLRELESAVYKLQQEFKQFYDGIQAIIKKADEYLKETLENYPQHEPHMALFLAFLQIFEIAQKHLNTLTRKHLNYYYREVLQVEPIPAKPDEVHLVFQLAKNFPNFPLKKDTELKAGKDDNKVNMFFKTDDDLLINRGQLDEGDGLKSIFVEKVYPDLAVNEQPGQDTKYIIKNIYAAPKANTADGLGSDILDEDGKWQTLGSSKMPYAEVGFAVASPLFLLKEGIREIILSFTCKLTESWPYDYGTDKTSQAAQEIMGNITPWFTGEKGWVKTSISGVEIEDLGDGILNLKLAIKLYPEAEPFLNYDSTVFEEAFKTKNPVIKFIFNNEGLEASELPKKEDYASSKSEVLTKIPPVVQKRILKFLNSASNWEEIAAIERSEGPILDNPFTGSDEGNEGRGYDIGETVATKIIEERDRQGGQFTDFEQLLNISGLGTDKFNDLFYTFSLLDHISEIQKNAKLFVETTPYETGTYVIYEGQYYYKALTNSTGLIPPDNPQVWRKIDRSYPYKYFQPLEISKMDIELDVQGIQNLILENDVGTINPAKPFQPFGPLPKIGSKFFIGSHEIFKKQLKGTDESELEIEMSWADLPKTSFLTHYQGYNSLPTELNNEDFKVQIEKLENGEWDDGLGTYPLFESNTNSDTSPKEKSSISLEDVFTTPDTNLGEFSQLKPNMSRGFIRLKLERNFFHKDYPPSLTTFVTNKPGGNAPNEPYTPILNSIILNYRTKETITFEDKFFEDRTEQLFHIEPFGWKEIYPYDNGVNPEEAVVNRKLIPEFLVVEPKDTSVSPKMTDSEGNLLIGITGLTPPQSVSILFQVAEGSSDPALNAQEVTWSYLSHNQWTDFQTGEIISDTTNGLLTSGIITFAIPREATNQNTRLKAALYWIKASVARSTTAISQAIAIIPQAVKATFNLTDAHDQDRLKNALPAETIAKLRERQAAIKKVLQPYASFGGKVKEQVKAPEGIEGDDRFNKEYNEYYIRVSERLRHKNRGITIFDYERLVLQQFPDIYKVKCLNHTRIADKDLNREASEHAPGFIKLIVLPHLRNKNAIDPTRPRVSLNRLEEVKSFLRPRMSDFVTLEVKNPIFEEIQVDFKVKFYPLQEANRGFYENLLNEDIKKFLSPWLYQEGEDLQLGGRIHRSLILNYIEERDYVDFVTDFTMNHIIDEGQTTKIDIEEAIATTSSSVIVSFNQHIIKHDIEIPCPTPSSF